MDFNDYLLLEAALNDSVGPGEAAAAANVPEPQTLTLLAIATAFGALAVALRGRRFQLPSA